MHKKLSRALAGAVLMGMSTALAHAASITIGIGGDCTTLDPQDANDTLSMSVQRLIMPGLFGFDETMNVVPVLAEKYEVSDDAKTFTISLKKDIAFQDGTPFNADAVKLSFDRVINPENKLKRYTLFSNIKSVEVVDPSTVKFDLKEPFASMINVLAHPSAGIISPAALAKYKGDIGSHPVGAGPFAFSEWQRGTKIELVRNEHYYKPGLPKLDGITLKPTPENGSRVALLLTGDAQFIYPMAPEQMNLLASNDSVEAVAKPSVWARYLVMNTLKPPFDNQKVRQAINYALDKDAFTKIVFSGFAEPLTSIVASRVQFYQKQGPWPYDPEKAKQLLAEAGFPQGFQTELWGSNSSTSVRGMEFLQQQLSKVGITVKVVPMESGQRVEKMQNVTPETGEMSLSYGGWSPSTGEADWGIRPLFATASQPPKSYNLGFYSNPKVDDLIKQGLAVPDESKRAEIYGEIQKTVWNDAPWAFLSSEQNTWGKAKGLSGIYVLPDGSLTVTDEAELKQ
jgi:glutathione transport system substrate-binding protein